MVGEYRVVTRLKAEIKTGTAISGSTTEVYLFVKRPLHRSCTRLSLMSADPSLWPLPSPRMFFGPEFSQP